MAITVPPEDPRHQQVIDQAFLDSGLYIPDVLPAGFWRVALVGGSPRLMITPDGVRLIASMSSNPDSAEDTIEQARRRQAGEG